MRWIENRRAQGHGGWHRAEDGTWALTEPSDPGIEGVVVLERSGAFVTPVQSTVTFVDGESVTAWWDGQRTTDTLTFPGRRVVSVSLDPDRHLELEAERLDNHRYARRDARPTATEGDLADLTEAALLSALLGVAP